MRKLDMKRQLGWYAGRFKSSGWRMRRGFWLRALIGLVTAVIGSGIVWAGYALLAPQKVGLKTLPSEVNLLPFDRAFWAVALMLLGGAALLHALPHPFWTKSKRRPAATPAVAIDAVDEPPLEPDR